jgi:hypothetical protein
MPVSRFNQKFCSRCRADITFAKRTRGEDGLYLCAACTSAASAAWAADLEQLLPPGTHPQQSEVFTPPSIYVSASTSSKASSLARPRRSNATAFWVAGGIIAVAIAITASVLVFGKSDRPAGVLGPQAVVIASAADAGSPAPANPTPSDTSDAAPIKSPVAAVVTLTRTAAYKASADYVQVCTDADRITSTLRIDLLGEDSAYRGLSRRSKARRDLLALFVRVRGHCDGSAVTDVDGSVRHVLAEGDVDLAGEDSAMQAIYLNDRTALRLLGLWCQMAGSPGLNLSSEYDRRERVARDGGSAGISAPQAIDAYSEAAMHVLAAILSARGSEGAANAYVRDVMTAAVGETSAWRSAMRNEEANLNLFLLLIDAGDHAKASQIRSSLTTAAVGEDSALRSQEDDLQGQVDALDWLIAHP